MVERLMLLDTAALYFRAFYGVPESVRGPDGTPVNAVRGLLDFIARLVTEYQPTHLVACWDDDWRPEWRVALIPSYKTHRVAEVPAREQRNPAEAATGARAGAETQAISGLRATPARSASGWPVPPERVRPVGTGEQKNTAVPSDIEIVPDPLAAQVPLIRTMLELLEIQVCGVPEFEADDVIASLASRATMPVDVVTSDRDLLQLVDDTTGVRMISTARGMSALEAVTEREVVERYGVTPQQYVDFAVLRGDPSDGLPGVKGIGPKSASALLTEYLNLESVMSAAADPASSLSRGVRAKILDSSEYLAVAPTVVRVVRDLPVTVAAPIQPLPAERRTAVEEFAAAIGVSSAATRALRALGNPQ